jgi:phage repressor protein C with HTH and peptisase S24 domain
MNTEVKAFRTDWISEDQLNPAELAWERLDDASMEPAIYAGDSYVIDTSQINVIDGKTYAVWYGGALRPRKMFTLPTGGFSLVASNSEFMSADISAADVPALKIVGRVVHRAGKGGL